MIVAERFYSCSRCSCQAYAMHNMKNLLEADFHGHSGGVATLESAGAPFGS